MTLDNVEISPIKGVSLGLEYEEDEFVYGDTNVFYIVLDLFILRFLFQISR